MFCKRGIYVNWGNIPHLEFDFGPVNLFSGGNGSGKTTAADGLQSLMTAAHENLFTYNPGQDETTQRGRGGKQVRTLASYILGCDDGSYARTRLTDGYVAGVFHPTKGEDAEAFTAVMCVRARLDEANTPKQARQEDLQFLILPFTELKLSHFVKEDANGRYVVPFTDLANELRMEFGKDLVEAYEKKGPYLRRLYGMFRGMKGALSDREAKHAARTFSNFMAYKPVKSINDFVSQEVLEPKDLTDDIRQVSELMKTIHSMDEETRSLKEAISNLELARSHAEDYVQGWIDHCVGEYTELSRRTMVKQQDYLKQKDAQRINLKTIADTELQLRQNEENKRLIHDQLVELEAQRRGIDVLKTKDQLEVDVAQYQSDIVKTAPELLKQDQQFGRNYDAANALQRKLNEFSLAVDIPALESKTFRHRLKQLLDGERDTGLDLAKLLTKDWVDISELEHRLAKVHSMEKIHSEFAGILHDSEQDTNRISVRDQLFSLLGKRDEQRQKSEQQIGSKTKEIQQLENRQVSYPPHVEAAIDAIHRARPEAKPCVLCDFVEVTDPEWQMAIEGYLGFARFSIIVEPEYEAEAIRIVRLMKGGRNNARIIQGAKVQKDAAKIHVSERSIFNVMQFEHKIVEYYIKASYGSVLCVQDEAMLRTTARGITAEGLGSGGYSMFRCDLDDGNLVFGQGARERALVAKNKQLQILLEQRQQHENAYQDVSRVKTLVNQIHLIQCGETISHMVGSYRRLEKAELQLANLDLSNYESLEKQLESLRAKHAAAEAHSTSLSEERGSLESKKEQFELVVKNLSREQDVLQQSQENQEASVNDISRIYPDFSAEGLLVLADARAQSAMENSNFVSDNLKLLEVISASERALYEAILQHNGVSSIYNAIAYQTTVSEKNDANMFKHIVVVSTQIAGVYNALKNNVLVGKHEQLSALKESFNTAFITNLCHSIFQSINEGKRILSDLNKELEHHVFGSDQERFYFGWEWVPEYQEYWRFFKEVIEKPSLGDGESLFDAELSEKSCEVRDKLMSMLLDKDTQYALRELQRISDYRRYREYEIFKQPLNKDPIALSKYGTGSGGQLETPAYIIRAAAVTSAFKFSEGKSHCRMVLVDEAFSKMDEARSREVINYLTQTLGLQLIFIMPTSKSGPFMDLISHQVVFSKVPTKQKVGELNTRVLVDRKVCNQDRIKELWAGHRRAVRQQGMLDFMEDIV
ncbi:MAG: hypothetical protein ACI9VI_001514 [Candidatus Azotimanducaceae bacterium]|jgi:hypothetical protein